MDATRLSRLRWRCRRGMLENDLILTRFLDARGERMTEKEAVALGALLDLADGELAGELVGQLVNRRGQHPARHAPFRPEIHQGRRPGVDDLFVEIVVRQFHQVLRTH